MEILSAEFQTHLEEVARKAGAEAALEAIQNHSPAPAQERKKNLVDVKQLAKETGVSIPTLIRHRNNGLIEGFRFGGRVFYDSEKVISSMQSTKRV